MSYSLVEPPHPAYRLAHATDYEPFLETIQQLPDIQTPNVFGMHDNVTIGRDLLEGQYLISSLLALQGCYSSGVDESGEADSQDESSNRSTDVILGEIIADLLQQVFLIIQFMFPSSLHNGFEQHKYIS